MKNPKEVFMLICLLSKQIFANLLKIRRSSFSKSACLFLRFTNRMTQKQNPQTNPVGKCKGKFKIYGLRETIRDIVHIKRNTELYTISQTHILSNVSDMQHDINCTRNKMTIGHNECSAPFLTHQMGNIYEQFMFLLHP